jgi:hypothetical protein
VSAGKFVGGAITEAVLRLNPFGKEGYERRAKNKAYRKARRKQKRGKELTADEVAILSTKETAMLNGKLTYSAIGIMAIIYVGQLIGVEVAEEQAASIVSVIAGLIGAYGRWRATTKPAA